MKYIIEKAESEALMQSEVNQIRFQKTIIFMLHMQRNVNEEDDSSL